MCMGGRLRSNCCSVIVPLCGALSDVKIVDFSAEVTLKQRFENQEKDPIEAV